MEPDFFSIYDTYYDRIKGFILTKVRDEWVAEDLTQETFLRAFRNIASLREHTKLAAWIFRIASNICLDHFRRDGGNAHEKMAQNRSEPDNEILTAQSAMERKQMNTCVQQKMGLLPKPYRDVLWLFEMMGLTQKEIADNLNLSLENVKVRLHRARRKLKVILRNHCQFEKDARNVLVCEPKGSDTSACSAEDVRKKFSHPTLFKS